MRVLTIGNSFSQDTRYLHSIAGSDHRQTPTVQQVIHLRLYYETYQPYLSRLAALI